MSTLYTFDYRMSQITVSGRDILDFFHRVSSQNFKSLKENSVIPAAFLTAQAGVIALFHAWYKDGKIHLFLRPEKLPVVLAHIDKFHFGEDIKVESTEEKELWILSSEKPLEFQVVEDQDFSHWPSKGLSTPWGIGLRLATKHLNTFMFLNSSKPKDMLTQHCHSGEGYEAYQNWHMIPTDGVSITEKNIILEASLLEYIHRNKGCYPGQEVIERIFTYGNVAKKLVRLEVSKKLDFSSFPLDLYSGSSKVGYLSSLNNFNGSDFAMGYVQRALASTGQRLVVSNSQVELNITKVVDDIKD